MLVFSAETSCDETSICLMDNDKIIDHIVFSQDIHSRYGGVVPELASRSHLEKLQEITNKMFKNRKINPNKIDIFAATCGPGLIGSLLVGATFVKSLSLGFKKPFVPINHLEGHLLSTSYNNKIIYPNITLLLTGGHTQIYLMNKNKTIKLLGESKDDAIGEAFDKTAKLIGLPYPGGSQIEKKAKKGDENYFILPKPLLSEDNFNFSFSGIKTHINLLTKKNKIDNKFTENLCASFQKTISEILLSKLDNAIKKLKGNNINIKSVSIVGGVSNNNYLRDKFEKYVEKKGIEIYYPIKEMMSDNAAMIAWAYIIKSNNIFDINFKADPRLKIG